MATITNSGTLNYSIGEQISEVDSNEVSTELNVAYSATVVKGVHEPNFVPGDVLDYQIHIKNTGNGTLYSLRVVDDLGTEAYGTPLSYVDNSVSAFLYNNDGTVISPLITTITESDSSITFDIEGSMIGKAYIVITYKARVDPALDSTVVSITNDAVFTALEGGLAGLLLEVTATETIDRQTVSIVKTVDRTQVNPGDELVYTFTMTNIGDAVAGVNTIVDQLPANFQVADTIDVSIGGTATTYDKDTDYTISEANVLTLEPDALSVPLTVPAATATAAGITTAIVRGTIVA